MDKTRLRNAILNAANRNAALVIKNANIVNVFTGQIQHGDVAVRDGIILGVGSYSGKEEIDAQGKYLCPGLIDAHVHIESSMAHPSRFADCVLMQGTTSVVTDPHEIANVCGVDGIQYMLDQTEWLPLSVFFMIPSCVPCTAFETSGAKIVARDMEQFLNHPRVIGLAELMDYISATSGEGEILDKLQLFFNRPIDGHAPLLMGDRLNAYCVAGPRTDHECTVFEEVYEKMSRGMHIQLRLGSACRGIEDITARIAKEHLPTNRMMFCTDDKHLENIQREGHINYILRRAVANGIDPIAAVQMGTINAAENYGLTRKGAIAPGYHADMVLFDNLTDFNAEMVLTDGKVFKPAADSVLKPDPKIYNSVHLAARKPNCFDLEVKGVTPVISMDDNELTTKLSFEEVPTENGLFMPNEDLLKLAVLERHHASGKIGLGVLRGIRLHEGAIGTTVGHDSHNLIVAGDNDADMLKAVDALEECGGGFVVIHNGKVLSKLQLPIAGLMSDAPLAQIIKGQEDLLNKLKTIGSWNGSDPFVKLSFVALPVIPEARLTDMGVFDVVNARFVNNEE